jgi:hypothetical protein
MSYSTSIKLPHPSLNHGLPPGFIFAATLHQILGTSSGFLRGRSDAPLHQRNYSNTTCATKTINRGADDTLRPYRPPSASQGG